MKSLIPITLCLLALAACTDHTKDHLQPDGSTAPPIGPIDHSVTFKVRGVALAGFQFAPLGQVADTTVTLDVYTIQVAVPTQIKCVQPGVGCAVADWEGADWSSGGEATMLPSDRARTVTVVIAPTGAG